MIKAASRAGFSSAARQALARQSRTAYSRAKPRRGSPMTRVDITTTVEADGAHWLRVDTHRTKSMANQVAGICRSFDWPVNFHHTDSAATTPPMMEVRHGQRHRVSD